MPKKTKTEQQVARDAIARMKEEGHRTFIDRDEDGNPVFRIVSDSKPGMHFNVKALADTVTFRVEFECYASDPEFKHASSGKLLCCKHVANAVRRLVREGVIEWSDGWLWVTEEFRSKIRISPDSSLMSVLAGKTGADIG